MPQNDSKQRKNWKDHLLRSGIPLEYQVARILADEGMSVDADFSFLRRDGANVKELSVDIAANWYGPNSKNLTFELHLLVECKYRSHGKVVLFLEDPNDLYPPVTLGGTVNSYDIFVPYHLPRDAFVPLEQSFKYVYKGVELHESDAVEEDLRRGIQQLRYGIPALLRQTLDFAMYRDSSETAALFYTKILVTNAPLRVMHRKIDIELIKKANDINDISQEVETVILYSDYGPDYDDHFRFIFKEDTEDRLKTAAQIRTHLQSFGKQMSSASDPVTLLENLSRANRFECRAVGTQFFVTTLARIMHHL